MSFRKNSAQQMSIFDSTFGLTEREQKALDRSWAKIFSEDVFPQIDEERFSVLYSDKASKKLKKKIKAQQWALLNNNMNFALGIFYKDITLPYQNTDLFEYKVGGKLLHIIPGVWRSHFRNSFF